MKIRSGFVSNSSSSSFVVISDAFIPEDFRLKGYEGAPLILGLEGEAEFGWGPETLTDMYSRFNFAYLQTIYGHPEWLEQLNRVLIERTGASEIVWKISEDYDSPNMRYGYIDHQSTASEGRNTEIFANDETLERFLFGADSKIELDNDNR